MATTPVDGGKHITHMAVYSSTRRPFEAKSSLTIGPHEIAFPAAGLSLVTDMKSVKRVRAGRCKLP